MEVCYVLGRAGSGKTKYLFKEVERAIQQGRKAFYIVPEQYVLQAERELLQALGQRSLVGAAVLSVNRLAERVAAQAGPLLRGSISPHGLAMLVGTYAAQLPLRYYGAVAQKPGFYAKIAEQIGELERAMVRPEDLFAAAKRSSGQTADKLFDLGQIYQAVQNKMAGHYLDGHTQIEEMCERLGESGYLDGALVALDSLEDHSAQSTLFFSTLLDCCDKLMVALRLDYSGQARDRAIFSAQRRAFEGFREAAAQKGVMERVVELDNRTVVQKPGELVHLEANLFALPYERYKEPVAAIHLMEAPTATQEVEWICCQIGEYARRYSYSEIAVLADLQHYGALFERAFERYQIPYFTDQRRSLAHHPVAVLTSACLSCCEEGFLSRDMMALMKTGFCGVGLEQVERFENFAAKRGIFGARYKDRIDGEENADMEQIREQIMQPLLTLAQELEQAVSAVDMVGALYDYFVRIDLKGQLDSKVLSLYESGQMDLAEEYAQVWNRGVVELLEQAQHIFGENPCSISLLRSVLETGFDSLTLGIIPTTVDELMLGEAGKSYLHSVKILFVAGLNDALIPKAPEPRIVGDSEREKLLALDFPLLHTTRFEQDIMNHRIYTQLCKPQETLHLSFALGAADGAGLRPSMLVHNLKGMFPALKAQGRPEDLSLVCCERGTFSMMVGELRRAKEGEAVHPVWWDVLDYYEKNGYERRCALVRRALAGENSAKALPPPLARELFAKKGLSASRIEEYNRCPYRHFVRYGLNPSEREDYVVEALDLGTIYHDAIDGYIRLHGADKQEIGFHEARERMENILQPILQEYGAGIFDSSARYRHMAEQVKRVGARSVWAISRHIAKSGFFPLYSEVRFGKDGNFPPIVLDLQDGNRLEVSGRIDRVDGATIGGQNYLTVVDYKSGNAAFDYGQVYAGVRVQLLIYMQALLLGAADRGEEAKPAGLFYFKVDDPLVSAEVGGKEEAERQLQKALRLNGVLLEDVEVVSVMDESLMTEGESRNIPVRLNRLGGFRKDSGALSEGEMQALLGYAEDLSKRTVDRMLRGEVDILPLRLNGKAPCSYCDYAGICGFDVRLSNRYREERRLSKDEFFHRLEGTRDV
ncbi:MAG: PD-(D/E)XK nuclease family protein [Christensenellales bacterium]|jgi:ATP-dependent helicase/nuclease subunit B